MALVPLNYTLRSLWRRRAATFLTVISIGATVQVLVGILALRQGFTHLFQNSGREDVAVFLRPGATSEGESAIDRERAAVLIKSTAELEVGEDGQPLASGELYMGVRLRKLDGGETNVPIRGVQPATFDIRRAQFEIVAGRRFTPGSDEVIVGESLVDRIRNCRLDDVLQLNVTPFRVVGVFRAQGAAGSEIWGDVDRMMESMDRQAFSRVIGQVRDVASIPVLNDRLADDQRTPMKVLSESDYLSTQDSALAVTLTALAIFLAVVMGTAAVFTGTNTMLAAVASRTHEIGILLAIGFRPMAIWLAFLIEALILGALGGALGCVLALPLHGMRTGTTNFNTFTEVAFAFRVSASVMVTAIIFSLVLGLIGGAWPAFRAARLRPTQALRRE